MGEKRGVGPKRDVKEDENADNPHEIETVCFVPHTTGGVLKTRLNSMEIRYGPIHKGEDEVH